MPPEQVINNFLGLSREESDYATSRYAVLPIPYDSSASFKVGTREGPAAIIAASQHVELFDEELRGEFHGGGVATLDALWPNMSGPEAMHGDIFKVARGVVRDGKFLIGLGGDHSITSALVRAAMTQHKNISVLQIDAHADLRDQFEQARYSHASVMRRVHEMGVPIVSVGLRAWSKPEDRTMRKPGITAITARECIDDDDWVDRAIEGLTDTVYVTLDIDGFDPAYAPGTGTPEPGGLDWYQVTSLLRLVAAEKRIVGADVVEVIPLPGQAVTEFLAARLVYKLICYVESGASLRGG